MARKKDQKELVIYQAPNGAIELRGDFEHETVWASQADMARIFGVTPQNVTLHIKNIFSQRELSRQATCKESFQVQTEGERKVPRVIEYYNLDAILSVGYRVNSKTDTKFRQWATKTLREHITKGYTINRTQIGRNYDAFMKAVADVQALLPEHVTQMLR